MDAVFADRADAGRRLAVRLAHLRGQRVVVLGLPRGGVPVALEVARALGAPLDVIVVRKLGVPFQPELGMGAIGEDGTRILNEEIIRRAGVSEEQLAAVEADEHANLERRVRRLRGSRPRQPLEGRVAVVVDDGIATGSTARAACQVARARGAARVVLAVPVAPPGWEAGIGTAADELACVDTPEWFSAIGQFYADFAQVSDDEVGACLDAAAAPAAPAVAAAAAVDPPGPGPGREVEIRAGTVGLAGYLTRPGNATGIVLFGHASATGRHSPFSRYLAIVLNQAGLGTLLVDLLTPDEQLHPANVLDISLLACRLARSTQWARAQPDVVGLPIGYLGAGTGAAAAIWAAAEPGAGIAAVVSCSGHTDLARASLGGLRAPTLLIAAGRDNVLLRANRRAQAELGGENRLEVVPGATFLFEERGTLAAVAGLAAGWFTGHLAPAGHPVT